MPWKSSTQLADASDGRDQRGRPVGEPARRARRASGRLATANAAETKRSAVEPAAEVRDDPREEEVQRRAAALAEHGVASEPERAAADEERERLVLVRRPGREPEERGRSRRRPRTTATPARKRRCRERPSARIGGRTAPARAVRPRRMPVRGGRCYRSAVMPIYEYRCPNGHLFELFQRMADAAAGGVRGVRRGARSSACSTRSRCTSRARASTRPTTGAAGASREGRADSARARRASRSASAASEIGGVLAERDADAEKTGEPRPS